MRTSLWLFSVILAMVPFACTPEQRNYNSVGSGGAGATGGSGGSEPSSSSSSTSSSSSSTSSSAMSSSSSASGGSCAESPCKLVAPQCGCAGGDMCAVDAGGNRSCVSAGATPIGAECGPNGCEPGGWCGETAPTIKTCQKFCASDSDCVPPGGLCLHELANGSSGSIPGIMACTENCDPSTNVGCPIAGTGCYLEQESSGQMRGYTKCGPAGTATQSAPCMSHSDCAPTYGCFNAGTSKCLQYCKVGGGPACPGGLSCVELGAKIGNTAYGACL